MTHKKRERETEDRVKDGAKNIALGYEVTEACDFIFY